MGLNLNEMISTYNNIEIPAGYYPSRLVGIIELGLQKTHYKGTPKQQEQIALLFEVYTQDIDEEPIEPMLLGKIYTKIIRENSNLGKVLKAIRNGIEFTKEELEKYTLSQLQLLGSPCNVYIDTYEKDGQTKLTIKEVAAFNDNSVYNFTDDFTDNIELPPSQTEYIYFDMDDSETWHSFIYMCNGFK